MQLVIIYVFCYLYQLILMQFYGPEQEDIATYPNIIQILTYRHATCIWSPTFYKLKTKPTSINN